MKGWLDKYQDGGELDDSALSGVKNILSAVGDVTSAPARGLTYLATGKYQDPSEAMGITNPYGAFATDLVLDPMNLVGAGLLKLASGPSKLSKVTKAAGKLSKAADVASTAKNYKSPDIKLDPNKFPGPKNIPINPKQFNQAVKSTLSALTERGQKLDQVTGGKFNVTPDDIHYHGTFGGRPIVEVKTPYGSEHFYKSTGWAGKKEINPGQWQAFGQWMDAPAGTVRPNPINDWFVKGPGFDKFYGSQSFGNVANSLDDALIKKYNVPSEDLNKFLNFQNMQSDANTFIPKRNNGGWLDKYNDGGPVQPNYNEYSVSAPEGFEGDGYSNVGRNYSPAWGGQFQDGGNLSFISNPKLRNMLEGYKPGLMDSVGDYRLPEGYMAGSINPSTEVSISIGGEDGEPAYLIPSFKYGQPLQDPVQEFNMTGQHLGGPFKTWQDAEKFQEIRHQYVEKGQPLPSPIATSNMAMGGSMPGAVGFTYARVAGAAPSNGKYAKKTMASAQNGTEMEYYQNGLDWKPKNISKNGKKVIKDDRGQWDHPGEITEIGSNQITMQGVPYPVLGISDTGDTQMMYPDENYVYDGESVTEYPMMAEGGITPKNKPLVNLGDFTMTSAELEYVNAPNSGYCPRGNCLENTRKAYDMTAGRVKGIPSSNDISTKDLGLTSTASRPTEKQVKQYPYFEGDSSFGSSDSWDQHGAIVKAGGKNIYSQAKGQTIPTDIAIGSFLGWGPAGTRTSSFGNRQKGLNTKYGLQPSHHSTQVVSYNEQGEAIVYDSYLGKYGTISDISKDLKKSLGYELENISVPKSVAGNTRDSLSKRGLLKTEATPYTADVNKLLSGTKQDWAQINEDGNLRSPKPDREKLNTFAKALSDNKGELMSSLKLNNSEFNRIANTAMALQMVESEGGGALGFADSFGSTQGMTQLNPKNLTGDARLKSALSKKYNTKSSVTNLLDPASSAIATMMYLSVAEKDAKRLYDKGLKPGVKTFNQPGFIENFRSTNSRLNKDGVFIDELNKRVPYSEIPGYNDEDVTKVNNYLKKVTKSDKYNFVNKDGDLSLKMKTKGNNPKLTDIEKIGYMWQSPNSLKTGDAEGKSEYVNKIKNYYNLLSSNKMEQGGQLTKLDQLTNFTNYNTKQPGGWLDKYQ